MAYWAELDDQDYVLRVIVCDADDGTDTDAPAFCTDVLGGIWRRTFYDTEGHTMASIGGKWDADRGDFVSPEPEAVDIDQQGVTADPATAP